MINKVTLSWENDNDCPLFKGHSSLTKRDRCLINKVESSSTKQVTGATSGFEFFFYFLFLYFIVGLAIEPKALYILNTHFINELHPQPKPSFHTGNNHKRVPRWYWETECGKLLLSSTACKPEDQGERSIHGVVQRIEGLAFQPWLTLVGGKVNKYLIYLLSIPPKLLLGIYGDLKA